MKIITKEKILELQERMAMKGFDENFFDDILDDLEKENPILYKILDDEVEYFWKLGKHHNGIIIYSLLQVFYLLEPLPKVTEKAVQIAEQENSRWGSETEALRREIQLFRKENPYLHKFALIYIKMLDSDVKARVIQALMAGHFHPRGQVYHNEIKN